MVFPCQPEPRNRRRRTPGDGDHVIRRAIVGAALAVIAGAVLVNAVPRATVAATPVPSRPQMAGGIHTIKHVIVVMQENRSFDNYFGTFPGADGIPRQGTRPSACLPDPAPRTVRPSVPRRSPDRRGRPAYAPGRSSDIGRGRMDGFVRASLEGRKRLCVADPHEPICGASSQPTADPGRDGVPHGFGDPELLGLRAPLRPAGSSVRRGPILEPPVPPRSGSGWSARCTDPTDPMTCSTLPRIPAGRHRPSGAVERRPHPPVRVDRPHLSLAPGPVSWRYFVANGSQPDCADGQMACRPRPQSATTPGIWNPLPGFRTVWAVAVSDVQPARSLLPRRAGGDPPGRSPGRSQRPPQRPPSDSIAAGQAWVTPSSTPRAQPRLEQHRDLPLVGRLGRVLRPCRAADGERSRARLPRPRSGDQPVREARVHRPPGPVDRLVPAVHRGRLPGWPADRSRDRREAG